MFLKNNEETSEASYISIDLKRRYIVYVYLHISQQFLSIQNTSFSSSLRRACKHKQAASLCFYERSIRKPPFLINLFLSTTQNNSQMSICIQLYETRSRFLRYLTSHSQRSDGSAPCDVMRIRRQILSTHSVNIRLRTATDFSSTVSFINEKVYEMQLAIQHEWPSIRK